METTYTILDKDHWKIMQLDTDKTYILWPGYKVWQSGKGIINDYLINRSLDEKMVNALMWGTAVSS